MRWLFCWAITSLLNEMQSMLMLIGKVWHFVNISDIKINQKCFLLFFLVSSIVLLIIAIICSIGVSLSLQQIISAYDDQCVLNARLKFKEAPPSATPNDVSFSFAGASTNGTGEFAPLNQFFNETYARFLNDGYEDDEFSIREIKAAQKGGLNIFQKPCG